MLRGKKFNFACWLDKWRLAFTGLRGALFCPRFFIPAVIAFVIFGTLLNLLSGGTASFALLGSADFFGKLQILGNAFLKIFGVGQSSFLDWAFVFLISALQGILLGLVVFVFKARKNTADLQNVSIVAGLAILGSGCPTCGTTLLMPLLVSIAGSSSMALAGAVSWLLTAASIVVALFAFKKVGFETYAILADQKFRAKIEQKEECGRDKK